MKPKKCLTVYNKQMRLKTFELGNRWHCASLQGQMKFTEVCCYSMLLCHVQHLVTCRVIVLNDELNRTKLPPTALIVGSTANTLWSIRKVWAIYRRIIIIIIEQCHKNQGNVVAQSTLGKPLSLSRSRLNPLIPLNTSQSFLKQWEETTSSGFFTF